MNKQQELYELVPMRHEDIFLIMQWRNEQLAILRNSKPLTPEDQEKFYNDVVVPSFNDSKPRILLFSFLHHGDCIGYGGLVNIDWEARRAEVSFLLATKRAEYQKEFRVFLSMLKDMAFHDLHLDELFTETYDMRPYHVEVLEEQGFVFQNRKRNHEKNVDSLFHTCRSHHGSV